MKRRWREPRVSEEEAKVGVRRRCVWTAAEDELLRELVGDSRMPDWTRVAKGLEQQQSRLVQSKNAKQCRERWHNRLNPAIRADPWTKQEETRFFELHREFGPKWSDIAARLRGRTDNTIKNFFYCRLRKIARRISKGMVSEDMKAQREVVEQTLYLVNHLRTCYTSDLETAGQRDKYIVNMVRAGQITAEKISQYVKEYMAAVQTHNKVSLHDLHVPSDSEDSLMKTQSPLSAKLPPLPSSSPQPSASALPSLSGTRSLSALDTPHLCMSSC